MLSFYFGFSLFSFIASITPGPTNILALNQGHYLGIKLTMSFIIGASFGTGLILLLTALGLAEVIIQFPIIKPIIALIGASWLSVMSWKLFNTPPVDIQNKDVKEHHSEPGLKRLNGKDGCFLQFVNPKSWMMGITVSSLFPSQTSDLILHYILLAIIFSLVAIPCIAVWAYIGVILNKNAFLWNVFRLIKH